MLYAILAYHVEAEVMTMTPTEDATLMTNLSEVHARIDRIGKLGPAARLGSTGKAITVRGPGASTVVDGPFAETKEQLLGLYIVDVESEAQAIAIAQDLRTANPSAAYEVRPIALFLPGQALTRAENEQALIRTT